MQAPRPIQNIATYLINSSTSGKGLPSPVIVKGPSGTGKSWILAQIRQALEQSGPTTGVYPVVIPMQLSGHELVRNAINQIDAVRAKTLSTSQMSRVRHPEKYVLFIENIDRLFNLSRNERVTFTLPRRVKGAGAAQFHQIQHASEFRSFLIENAATISTVATAGPDTSFMDDPELPFYQFFNVLELRPLNISEAMALLTQRLASDTRAQIFLKLFNQLGGDQWAVRLTDGKIAFLNYLADTMLVDIQREDEFFDRSVERTLSTFFSLYFLKLVAHFELVIEQLSYSERRLMDIVTLLPDRFQTRDVEGLPSVYNILSSLRSKGVLVGEEAQGTVRHSFSSSTLKAYLRFQKGVNLTAVLNSSGAANVPGT